MLARKAASLIGLLAERLFGEIIKTASSSSLRGGGRRLATRLALSTACPNTLDQTWCHFFFFFFLHARELTIKNDAMEPVHKRARKYAVFPEQMPTAMLMHRPTYLRPQVCEQPKERGFNESMNPADDLPRQGMPSPPLLSVSANTKIGMDTLAARDLALVDLALVGGGVPRTKMLGWGEIGLSTHL